MAACALALVVFGMGVTMTVPMVGWMRYRGHGWPASAEMGASMFIPTFGVMALLWTGLVPDFGTRLAIDDIAEHAHRNAASPRGVFALVDAPPTRLYSRSGRLRTAVRTRRQTAPPQLESTH